MPASGKMFMNFGLGGNSPPKNIYPGPRPLPSAGVAGIPVRIGNGFGSSMFQRLNVRTTGGGGCGCGK